MVSVIKASGQRELFSEEKLRYSIHRAGIPLQLQESVTAHVKSRLYENIPTREIYHHITEFLGQSEKPFTRAKYSLKQAIMSLGPTGYPFEDFVAELLKTRGYATQVRSTLPGGCIHHEIDVIAQKQDQKIMVEAKFHNIPGRKTTVHVALYTKARFDDIKNKNNISQVWLITNTKITIDVIAYAGCVGMKVISWDYPSQESLRDIIEKSGLWPLTALSSLSQNQKQQLLENRIVFSKQICDSPSCLTTLNLSHEKQNHVISEAQYVTNHHAFQA